MRAFVNSDDAGDLVTHLSRLRFVVFINSTPILFVLRIRGDARCAFLFLSSEQ